MDNSTKTAPENDTQSEVGDESIKSKERDDNSQESSSPGATEQSNEGNGDEDAKKMFVGALSPNTDENSMRLYFTEFGEIVELTIKYDLLSKRSKGYGFISFSDKESVDKVLSKQEHILDGRIIDPKRLENRKIPNSGGKTKKIFVGGVPTVMPKRKLESYFGSKGDIDEIALVTNKTTNTRRGFVFITFKSERTVDELVKERFHHIDGNRVEVKKATPREQQLNNKLCTELQMPQLLTAASIRDPTAAAGLYSQFSPYYPYQFGFTPYSYGFYSNPYGMTPGTQSFVPVQSAYGNGGGGGSDAYHGYR